MAYCTRENIQDKITDQDLIRLTDEAGAGVADFSKIDDAIAEAQAEVDSYCVKRHTVPFADPAPAMISKVCKDITVYNLWSLRHAAPDDCEDRYKKAVSYLEKIAAGTVDLGGDSPEQIDDGGPASTKSSSDRIFTMDSMESF